MNGSQNFVETLKQEILEKDICKGLKDSGAKLVFDDYKPDAKIMVIGEAPGATEDREGKPFVGMSGKILREALKNVGLEDKDFYITNTVKYRPPKNRDPKISEKQEFLPFLYREIKEMNPVLIILCGRHAMGHFVEGEISKNHGKIFKAEVLGKEYQFLVSYHPSATIYRKEVKKDFVKDLQIVKEILKKID